MLSSERIAGAHHDLTEHQPGRNADDGEGQGGHAEDDRDAEEPVHRHDDEDLDDEVEDDLSDEDDE